MIALLGDWAHAAAAILFGALGVWQLRRRGSTGPHRALIAALALTAGWCFTVAATGATSMSAELTENLRNLAWLGFMFLLLRQGRRDHRRLSVSILYAVLSLIGVGMIAIDIAPLFLSVDTGELNAIRFSLLVLHMIVAIGALVLVHNLYTAAAPEARWGIRLPMIALAVMWIYDLNLYTLAWLARDWPAELLAMRGLVMMMLAPIFGLAARRNDQWQMRLSRTVAFQSFSLAAIGGYLVMVVLVTNALNWLGGDYVRLIQVVFVVGTSVAALVLLPSARFRAWFNVKIAKHFFAHRYDYREEWLRFTDTLGRPAEQAAPLDQRIVKAVADITDSPGGVLLVPADDGGLVPQARMNWRMVEVPLRASAAELVRHLELSGRIMELDALRAGGEAEDDEAALVPEWMLAESGAWALVPLLHFERLQGAVLLERPRIARKLDWEDFDLLRLAGRQVASYLAEARGEEALSDARRFDEFNRRFAFIMHDIKNLVSQLSLVARNAERHADNPEFRADMVATLQSSVGKMNDLLARLSQHNKARPEEPRPVSAARMVEALAAARRTQHPVVAMVTGDPMLLADPARLEQALAHLIQNAIDASPPNEPVTLKVVDHGHEIAIEVRDSGAGMSAEFIRASLFKPFASTKDGGFGVGAYEARALVTAMGGRLDVESLEDRGSVFTVTLSAAAQASPNPQELLETP
ncbi:XrtA/PEP-CTERM system histidine kinase PrsK [Sphingomonas cavernae]|uniref:histidine kinase n=1 Tax=Sphingomonas cavernae TaxID=2320861 RepID=A0A418WQK1_9SPHN|nr:XrtA/PEP-CTERM system histidine kinase PrsK [Sphingomonas cavernae]RJF93476.1 PEP-CTERM system histidine kinase PrsK [Sphingomonas cavernae]